MLLIMKKKIILQIKKKKPNKKFLFLIGGFIFGIIITVAYFQLPELISNRYTFLETTDNNQLVVVLAEEEKIEPEQLVVSHIKTPLEVKAIYMSSWVAGTQSIRNKILKDIEGTNINAIVIDIKDYTGRISFNVSDPYLQEIKSAENRIPNIKEFIESLHQKNIYVIGRISSFQDSYLIKKRPDLGVKKESNKSVLWKDKKGVGWLDAGSEEVWKYLMAIGEEAYQVGFDELNFDYIRFPSDGNMSDIYYPFSEGKVKADVIRNFSSFLYENFKDSEVVLSADVFGMTTINTDDLNIGQILEYMVPYFDFVSPMVYPSHYPKNWNGIQYPAQNPYQVVKYSLDKAVERMKIINQNPNKIRPWLQDFNLGATYTPQMVNTQIQAVFDSGLSSWMLWDAGNTYTIESLSFIPITEKTEAIPEIEQID